MGDDIAVLGIEIDSRNVRGASKDLDALTAAAKKAQAGTKTLGEEAALAQRSLENMLGPLRNLQSLLIGLGIGAVVREVIQLADAYTLTTARLRLVTKSTNELREVQSALFQIAQTTGSSFAGTAELYTRMARNADALGVSTAEMLRINELFTKSLKISGVSAAETESVIRQFTQSLTKGKVSGDEFNSLLENAGGLLDHVAKGLGITTQALVRMGKDGGVATSLILQGLGKSGALIDEQFTSIPKTVGSAMQEVKNAFGLYVDQINTSTGTTKSLAEAISGIADVFQRPEFQTGGIKFAEILAGGIEKAVELGPAAANIIEDIGGGIGLIIDGYMKLPEEVREWGVVVGILLGKKGLLALAAISALPELLPRIAAGVEAAWKKHKITDLASDIGQTFAEGFKAPLDAGLEGFMRLNVEMLRSKLAAEQAAMGFGKVDDSLGNLNLSLKEQHEWTTKDQQAWDALMRTYDKEIELGKRQRKMATDTVQGLRDKVAVMKQELTLGTAAAARLELEISLREKLAHATGAEAEEVRGLLDEIDALNLALGRKAENDEAMKAQADFFLQIWKNATEEIQRSLAETFNEGLRGNIKSFQDFGSAIIGIWRQVMSQVMAANVMMSLGLQAAVGGGGIGGAAAAAAGGAGGASMAGAFGAGGLFTGTTGAMGALNTWGFNQFGLGTMNISSSGTAITGGLGSIAGGAMIGGALGYGAGELIGQKNPYAMAAGGAALGGLYMAGALTGPVGAAIAALALIGSQFGARPSSLLEGNKVNLGTGAISPFDLGPNKNSPENRQMVDQLAKSVLTFANGLKSATGGTMGLSNVNFSADRYKGYGVSFDPGAGDGSFNYFKTMEEAWRFTVQRMVESMKDMPAEFDQAIKSLDFSTESGATAAFEKLGTLQKFLDLEAAMANPSGPVSAIQQALDQVNNSFNDMRATLEAFGITAERVNKVLDDQIGKIREQFSGSIDRTYNDVFGLGFLNDIKDQFDIFTGMKADAGALGISDLTKIDAIFTQSVKNIIGGAKLTAEQLNLIKSTFSNIPTVVAAADAALTALNGTIGSVDLEAQRKIEESQERVRQLRIKTLNDELTGLRDIQSALRGRISGLNGVVSGSDNALFRLATDAQFGLSAPTRLENIRGMWASTKEAAAAGDLDAQARLPELGLKLLEISRELNASGSGFWKDRDEVEGVLENTRSIAVQQLEIARKDLAANEAQIALLQGFLAALQNPGSAPGAYQYTRGDFNALFDQYGKDLAGGASKDSLVSQYEPALFEMYRNTSDIPFLMEMYNFAKSERGIGGEAGASAGRRYDIIADRLEELDALPGRAIGGGAGTAFRAHPNEVVFLGNKAQVLTASQAQDALASGASAGANMESAYRIGTQAMHGSLRELVEEARASRKEMRGLKGELRRIKEKVGA